MTEKKLTRKQWIGYVAITIALLVFVACIFYAGVGIWSGDDRAGNFAMLLFLVSLIPGIGGGLMVTEW